MNTYTILSSEVDPADKVRIVVDVVDHGTFSLKFQEEPGEDEIQAAISNAIESVRLSKIKLPPPVEVEVSE